MQVYRDTLTGYIFKKVHNNDINNNNNLFDTVLTRYIFKTHSWESEPHAGL